MVLLGKVAFLALSLSATGHALQAVILADTNRDGDVNKLDDIKEKREWKDDVGAMFLANIGDSGQRCAKRLKPEETPDEEIHQCNDAEGNEQRNEKYVATLRIPRNDASSKAKGTITLRGTMKDGSTDHSKGKVRIFHRKNNQWIYIDTDKPPPGPDDPGHFSVNDLTEDIELGIDARDVRRENGWDGLITVRFDLRDGNHASWDEVQLRVAPVLMHHALQRPEKAYLVEGNNPDRPDLEDSYLSYVSDLTDLIKQQGVTSVETLKSKNVFVRDWFASGFTSIPGPNGQHRVLHILVRTSCEDHIPSRDIFTKLRSDTVGAVQNDLRNDGYEAPGNLLIVPPYTDKQGKKYPFGRALMGSGKTYKRTAMMGFIESQGMQTPMKTIPKNDGLKVGHVDEYISFLPADNDLGWVMLVADPMLGLKLLKEAQSRYPNKDAMSRGQGLLDPEGLELNDQTKRRKMKDLFDEEKFPCLIKSNDLISFRINNIVQELATEIGLHPDKHILRIPTVFYFDGSHFVDGISRPSLLDCLYQGSMSLYGNLINGIAYLGGEEKEYIVPKPFGPSIPVDPENPESALVYQDIFEANIEKTLERIGYSVRYIDEWLTHHENGGEVHCGTNELRDASEQWWNPASIKIGTVF